ncbi:MAG: tetratricopeptide repeat protein, partial [Planctomycetes bacterium]|nr:tetratricopeptide repeat protein [Planctomycetota bacterium]
GGGQREAAAARGAGAAAAEKDSGQQEADRLQMGELSFRRGDFEGAAKAYQAIAGEKSEAGAKALQGLAWCAFELGNDEECARYVDAAIAHPRIGDGAPSMLELVSSLHHRAKQFDKAEIAARTFLNRFPKHPRAAEMRYALGVALARRDRNAEALATLEDLAKDGKAVQGLERPDRLWYELAWARRKQNDEKGALAAFAQVAASSKDVELVGEAKLHLGVAELAKLDGDATENGKNGANGSPKNAAAAMSDAEQKQADARAAELLQATQGRYRAQALYRLGFSRFERGDLEGAAGLFERILALGPDEAQSLFDEALFFAGECAYRRDDRNRARDAFVKLLERNAAGARAPMAKLHLGHVDLEDGRAAAAVRSLEEWILGSKDAPAGDRARAALWLGRARALRKDWDAAVASFEAATKLSDGPLGAEAQYRIGEARRDAGDLDGAIDAWLKLSILYGQPEWVQKGLLASAEGYLAQDQKAKAKKLLGELIERFAKSESAKAARNLLQKLSG